MEEHIVQHFYTPAKTQMEQSAYITWAGHRKCGKDHVVGPRVLETYKMVFVLSGKGYLTQGDHVNKMQNQGDMFILIPREKHFYYADPEDPWEIMWVSFGGQHIPYYLNLMGLDINHCCLAGIATHTIINKMLLLIQELPEAGNGQLLCISYLLHIFHLVEQGAKHYGEAGLRTGSESVVQQAVLFIEQNYYMHIDVDMLCKHVNYSRSYLSRYFKRITGMSIPEYISKIRIQNAKMLLQKTDLNIQEVSASVGITDSLYFSKMFKNVTGVSPMSYKKHNQGLLN
ncbi:AraC family transcriptional regulator [Paenibacillus sp. FSL R10-2736]|uniref:AraC family transcriptional regulator n=1 Tax=Paenibacillus sp. FSL R10-2736 TaxID=2954692 RepID=UPI0030F61BCB